MLLSDQAVITRLNSISPPYRNKRLRPLHHTNRAHSPIFHHYRDLHRHLDKYPYRMKKCLQHHRPHQHCCCCCCNCSLENFPPFSNKASRLSNRHKSISDESFRCSSPSPGLSPSASMSLSSPTWHEYDAEQSPLELSADEVARIKQQINADLDLIDLKLNTKNMNNEQLIKNSKILINYKKLSQVESCLLRSRAFLKKNFDLIYSQIKLNNKASVNESSPEYSFNESSPFTDAKFSATDRYLDKDSSSTVSSPSPVPLKISHVDYDKLSEITNKQKQRSMSKVEEKRMCRADRSVSRAKNKRKKRRKKREELNSNDINNNSDTCANKNFINYRGTLSRENEKQEEMSKHLKQSEQQVDPLEMLEQPYHCLHYSNDHNSIERRKGLFDLTENYKRQIDFSRSMIEFTLCLQKVLGGIDKVTNFNHQYQVVI